jgi:hypothetical protein
MGHRLPELKTQAAKADRMATLALFAEGADLYDHGAVLAGKLGSLLFGRLHGACSSSFVWSCAWWP